MPQTDKPLLGISRPAQTGACLKSLGAKNYIAKSCAA